MANKVFLVGRLGKDPEFKDLGNGKAVCNFPLATSEYGKDGKYTEWHNIVLFDKQAETAQKFLTKGSLVHLEGKIKTESYEKDGSTRHITKIVCNNLEMLSSKGEQDEAPAPAPKRKVVAEPEEDLPF